MSFIHRRNKNHFEPAALQESTEYLPNPACGWYQIYSFAIEEKQDFDELYWCLREDETIVLALVDIGAFRDKVISEEALHNLEALLDFFGKHEKEIILRISYDREGRGMEREPEFLKTVTEHMQQLGTVIRGYQEQILIVQGMLIGSWGEMHDSKFLSEERLKQLMRVWREALGNEIPIAVRTPQQYRQLHQEGAAVGRDKVGLFNDGMFGSLDHLGTYGWQKREEAGWQGQWSREEEIEFVGEIAAKIPYGGEAVMGTDAGTNPSGQISYDREAAFGTDARVYPNEQIPYDREAISGADAGVYPCKKTLYDGGETARQTMEEMVNELRRTNTCYLNKMHDKVRLEQWKEARWREAGVWDGISVYDYIGCHLGYRFVVRNAEITGKKHSQLRILIENTGFSTLKEEAELVLCIGNEKRHTTSYTLSGNFCGMKPQETKEVVVELPDNVITEMKMLSLKMRRKRDRRSILFANTLSEDGSVILGMIVSH